MTDNNPVDQLAMLGATSTWLSVQFKKVKRDIKKPALREKARQTLKELIARNTSLGKELYALTGE